MNGDTEITSMEEKACELMTQLNRTIVPLSKDLAKRDDPNNSFYSPQYTIRQVLENKISGSIPENEWDAYLTFGHISTKGGNDTAVYCGAIVTKEGKKCGEFMYHANTGKVDFFSQEEIRNQMLMKKPYFDPVMVTMSAKDFTRLCREGMGLDDGRGRVHLRPLTEEEFSKQEVKEIQEEQKDNGSPLNIRPLEENEFERLAMCYTAVTVTAYLTKEAFESLSEEEKEKLLIYPQVGYGLEPTMDDIEFGYDVQEYYVPSEAERPQLLKEPMYQNYISPVYMSGIEQKITDMKECLNEIKKDKEKAEESNDYGRLERKTPY